MKASAEFRAAVAAAIAPSDNEGNRDKYRRGDFPRADKTKDINMRYRWDLYFHACATFGFFDTGDLRGEHIDTVLRSIVPPLYPPTESL